MPTIFETITQKLPKPTEEQLRQLELTEPAVVESSKAEDLPLRDVVVR